MKKIITSTLIAGTLISVVSPISNAQATTTKSSEVKKNISSKKTYKLPKLNSKVVANGFKNGEYVYASSNNIIKSIKLDEKFSSVESKIGVTSKKQLFKQSNSTDMIAFYGKNSPLTIYGYSKKRTSKMEKIYVDGFDLTYDNSYSLKTVEKYFGKSDFSIKVKKDTLCRGYGQHVKILYNRINGEWRIDELIVSKNDSVNIGDAIPIPESTDDGFYIGDAVPVSE